MDQVHTTPGEKLLRLLLERVSSIGLPASYPSEYAGDMKTSSRRVLCALAVADVANEIGLDVQAVQKGFLGPGDRWATIPAVLMDGKVWSFSPVAQGWDAILDAHLADQYCGGKPPSGKWKGQWRSNAKVGDPIDMVPCLQGAFRQVPVASIHQAISTITAELSRELLFRGIEIPARWGASSRSRRL